ncbi:MAG: ABC transporter permease [Ruminococcus sp.]|nr:ABC transporter permease [Ruminococcus sp.]
MKNPLLKRLPRELKSDIGKYIALFLFLSLTIAFVSGFLVADNSLKKAYDDSFEKFTVEDGHFILAQLPEDDLLSDIENEFDISIYPLYFVNGETPEGHTVRFYTQRDEVDRIDVLKGEFPEKDDEIAIDRLYAENNNISVGDIYTADKKNFKVTALTAFSDYSCLYKNNADMMFDANKFTVALVTDDAFDSLSGAVQYCYAWVDHDRDMDDTAREDKSDEIMKYIAKKAVLTDFLAQQNNHAITFTGTDMGGDKVMIQWLLYIVIIVLAFAFAVTTRSTIEQEASVIGTLRASGYTRSELLWHYIALPLLTAAAAAVVGNILGYLVTPDMMASMYLHSYSLTKYTVIWNADAFVRTTLIPLAIILLVNLVIVSVSLSLSPLQFLRRDLTRKKNRRAAKLPNWRFLSRFRTRIILQNRAAYIILFIGIFFSSVLMLFGMMFSPLMDHFKEQVVSSKFSEYQYLLRMPLETDTEGAEKYCAAALLNDNDEEITIYGIDPDSDYITGLDVSGDKVYLSDGFMEKYGIESGDNVVLHEKYSGDEYTLRVTDKYDYPATLSVFMSRETFCDMFGIDSDSFSGYFSDEKITDIDEKLIAATITEHDLTIMADQLDDSMGRLFPIFGAFSTVMFVLMMYLLSKLVIEKNTSNISMIKILGYTDREASGLYSRATWIVVVLSLLISIPLSGFTIEKIYYTMMLEYNGWLSYWVAPWVYPMIFVIGVLCFAAVSLILMKKIKRIPLAQALKNME